MKTEFASNQYIVTEDQLKSYFEGSIGKVRTLGLWNIVIKPTGHGHYKVEATFHVNNEELVVKTVTSNMSLIDDWKDLMRDLFEGDKDDLVESMLCAISAEDQINETVFFRD